MAQTQNLILRIVAQRGQISSRELIDVTNKFGLSSDATRAAANRMAQAELLIKVGRGRGNLHFKIGPRAETLIEQIVGKILHLHLAPEGQYTWDGQWLVITFSIPEEHREKRDEFRSQLVEWGFGLLTAGVWVTPFDLTAKITALIEKLEVTGQVILWRGQHLWVPGGENIRDLTYRVWDLARLEPLYREFIDRVERTLASLEQVRQGKKADSEQLFFQAIDLQGEMLDILTEDPCLPLELLPPDWPSQKAHELLHHLADTIDELKLVDGRYNYLLYSIPENMETLRQYWPKEKRSPARLTEKDGR